MNRYDFACLEAIEGLESLKKTGVLSKMSSDEIKEYVKATISVNMQSE